MIKKKLVKAFVLALSFIVTVACEKEAYESENIVTYDEGTSIMRFKTYEDVVAALNNGVKNITTRSNDSFVSYLETVMDEPEYDDKPYAILSESFGSILNKDGELIFDNNLVHVSHYGILYGPAEKADEIRSLAINETLPDLCKTRGFYAPLSNSNFYKIEGYEDIYLYDTFKIIEKPSESSYIETRSGYNNLSGSLNEEQITAASVGFKVRENELWRYFWNKTFTEPSASNQKQFFADGKHCNDTKIYHQDYGIGTDTGLKTKTMKKRALGYWDKISGDMEAGIIELSLFEELPNKAKFPNETVSTVYYGSKQYHVVNRYDFYNKSIDYVLRSVTDPTIKNIANSNNANAVRYIINNTQAVTVFPYNIEKKTDPKIEMGFVVPFGGYTAGKDYVNGNFHVIHQKLFGLTVRDNEIRGTVIEYNF